MNVFMLKVFCSIVIIFCVAVFPQASIAQPSLEIKGLLREGMKECRAAKTLRRTNLEGALARFQSYRGLVEQALILDESLLGSNDSTVRRVLDFCNTVKADLDRAEALPLFERGLVECREARISLANGAFDEARDKHGKYIQYKESAIALTASVLNVYENSYELQLCEQFEGEIEQARLDYQRQATSLAANQENLSEAINLFTEALSQCRGAQSIINDKTRYSSQTIEQVRSLFASAKSTKKSADSKYSEVLAAANKLEAADKNRIERLDKNFTDCESAIPNGLAQITRTLQQVAKTDKPATGATNEIVTPKLKDTEFTQIVGAIPSFPARAARRGIEGFVIIKFTVTKTGGVADVEVMESQPSGVFDKSATNAVEKYKFQPRITNGVAVDAPGVVRKIIFRF